MDICWESKKINLNRMKQFVSKAADEGCDVAVLPEMFNTGFSMNTSVTAEDEDGETASVLSAMAKQNKIYIVAGYAVKGDGGKCENIAAVFNRKGDLIARYIKMHPFSFAGEDQHYRAGDRTAVFDIDGVTAGVFICYDLRFPEVFRSIAKQIQLIFVIANWPDARKEHWETLLKARAIENQCFVIGVNRTGVDGRGIYYSGGSRVYGPLGDELCNGSMEEFITCSIEPKDVAETRAKFPFLNDMKYVAGKSIIFN